MGDHEIAHVLSRSRDAARGIGFDKFKGLGFFGSLLVSIGHQRFQIVGKRLDEGGALHVQRRVDIVLDVLLERLP